MTQAALDQIVCGACSKSYRWKPELAGKKGKCKCGQFLQFPQDDPAGRGSSPMPVAVEAGEYELNEPVAASKPASTKATVGIKACRGCSGMLARDAVLCTRCGLNQTTGKKMATTVRGPRADAGGTAATAGKVVLSMVLGGVTAVICAALWIGVIFATGFTIGFMALGLGAATGGVMRLVNRNGGKMTGYAAAGFAVLALALVKLALIGLLVSLNHPISAAFRPFDVLWVILAVSSAYRMGSRAG